MANCKKCGSEIKETDRICPICGSDTQKDNDKNITDPIYIFASGITIVASLICCILGIVFKVKNNMDQKSIIGYFIAAIIIGVIAFRIIYLKRNGIHMKKESISSEAMFSSIVLFLGIAFSIMCYNSVNSGTIIDDLRYAIYLITGSILLYFIIAVITSRSIDSDGKTSYSGLKDNGSLFKGFVKLEDEMTGSIKYEHPVHLRLEKAHLRPNMDLTVRFLKMDKSDKYTMELNYYYFYTGDWLFLERIIFKTDTNRYMIDVSPVRENGAEWCCEQGYTELVREEDIKMLEDIATTQSLKIRFSGKHYYKDFEYNKSKKKKLVDAYQAYCGAKQEVEIHS